MATSGQMGGGMGPTWSIALASLVGLAASCGGESSSIPVHVEGVPKGTTVGIVTGASWIVDVQDQGAGADLEDLRVSRDVGAVTAFIDADNSGTFEPFREASAWCTRETGRWVCRLARESLLVRRQESVREGDVVQNTHIFARLFDTKGQLRRGYDICDGRSPTCSSTAPDTDAPPRWDDTMLTTCHHNWDEPFSAVVHHDGHETRYDADAPLALHTSVTLQAAADGGLVAQLAASDGVERHILWVGEVDDERQVTAIHWSSEDIGGLPASSTSLSVQIPGPAFSSCSSDCVVGYQGASRRAAGAVELHSQSLALADLLMVDNP